MWSLKHEDIQLFREGDKITTKKPLVKTAKLSLFLLQFYHQIRTFLNMSQHEEHKSHKFSVPNRCYVNGAASCNTVHVTGWSVGRSDVDKFILIRSNTLKSKW